MRLFLPWPLICSACTANAFGVSAGASMNGTAPPSTATNSVNLMTTTSTGTAAPTATTSEPVSCAGLAAWLANVVYEECIVVVDNGTVWVIVQYNYNQDQGGQSRALEWIELCIGGSAMLPTSMPPTGQGSSSPSTPLPSAPTTTGTASYPTSAPPNPSMIPASTSTALTPTVSGIPTTPMPVPTVTTGGDGSSDPTVIQTNSDPPLDTAQTGSASAVNDGSGSVSATPMPTPASGAGSQPSSMGSSSTPLDWSSIPTTSDPVATGGEGTSGNANPTSGLSSVNSYVEAYFASR